MMTGTLVAVAAQPIHWAGPRPGTELIAPRPDTARVVVDVVFGKAAEEENRVYILTEAELRSLGWEPVDVRP